MNTKEVVEMIDAITEGRNFAHRWEGNENSLNLATSDEAFAIQASTFGSNDPRIGREIAGALVAWANRKEGKIDVGNRARSLVDALVPTGADFPSVNDWSDINAGRITREGWYKLHVVNMSPEIIKRNIEGLGNASREWAPSSPKYHDTQKALDILREALPKDSDV